MRDTREFVFDGPYTRDELAEVMLLIAAGIRAGGLSLSMGQDEVTVFPRGALELDVVARTKDDKSRIDIAIAWRPAEGDMPASRWCDGAAGDQAGTGVPGARRRCRGDERMGDKKGFEFEGSATPAEAAEFLTRIAEGIRARALSLSMGDEEVTVFPDGDLSLEIEAREKRNKARIEVAIAWKRVTAEDGDGEDE
jgi:amphi-Trp domain-containing protein